MFQAVCEKTWRFLSTVAAQEDFQHFWRDLFFSHPNLDQNAKLISWLLIFFRGLGCWHSTSMECGIWTRPNQIRYDLWICRQICNLGDSSYNFWSRSTSLSQPTSLFNVVPTNRCKTRKYTIEQKNHQTTTKLSKFEKEIYVGICSEFHQCATSF